MREVRTRIALRCMAGYSRAGLCRNAGTAKLDRAGLCRNR